MAEKKDKPANGLPKRNTKQEPFEVKKDTNLNTKDTKTTVPEPKATELTANQATSDFPWGLLIYGVVQGVIAGIIIGGLLASFMWRDAMTDFHQLSVANPGVLPQPLAQPAVNCPSCAQACLELPQCEASTEVAANCVSETSDTFMERDPDVASYENPRLVPMNNVITPEQAAWLIRVAQANTNKRNAAIALSREIESYAWIYERVHATVVAQNKRLWKYGIPDDYRSELVENLHLVVHDNTTALLHLQQWHSDIGEHGHAAKRVLSGLMFLNRDFEGGTMEIMVSTDGFPLQVVPTRLWIMNSFQAFRKLPVTSGTQYALYYWVERY